MRSLSRETFVPREGLISIADRARALAVVALTIAFAALVGAPDARADRYAVWACHPSAQAGAVNAWTPLASAPLTTYVSCPPANDSSGLVARNSVAAGTATEGYGAHFTFTAPAGAQLADISLSWRVARPDPAYNAGLFTDGGIWLAGCHISVVGACSSGAGFSSPPEWYDLSGRRSVSFGVSCRDWRGCSTASTGTAPFTRASVRVYWAAVTVQDRSRPTITSLGGELLAGGWRRGTQGFSFAAEDNVGIKASVVDVDGRYLERREKTCNYTLVIPCPQGGDTYPLHTETLADGPHTLTLRVIDTADNVETVERTILIDNSPPDQPEGLTVEGGEGWRSKNAFRLRWRNPSEPGSAPITGASYELCPADGGTCRTATKDGDGITEIADVKVPRKGDYIARLWLRDAAGNEDRRTAGQRLRLRFDDDAPELAFEPRDQSDPTRIALRASDETSGVAGGEIEIRRRGAREWRSLATEAGNGRIVARLDDERLADGSYEVRGRAVDHAGNERSTDRLADGQRIELTLPVRVKTRLRSGLIGRDRSGRKGGPAPLLDHPRVRYGQSARLAGRLVTIDGAPLRNARVDVLEAPTGAARFKPLTALRTSRSGRFSFTAPQGASRTVRFRYPGTDTIRAATSDVQLRVAGKTSLRVSDRFALNGETVTFAGQLRGRPIPASGKLVELQAHVRGRWRTFATTRAGAHGSWRYAYRFDGTRGRQVYRFRARLPRESAYPYDSGSSATVSVTVRGL